MHSILAWYIFRAGFVFPFQSLLTRVDQSGTWGTTLKNRVLVSSGLPALMLAVSCGLLITISFSLVAIDFRVMKMLKLWQYNGLVVLTLHFTGRALEKLVLFSLVMVTMWKNNMSTIEQCTVCSVQINFALEVISLVNLLLGWHLNIQLQVYSFYSLCVQYTCTKLMQNVWV